MLVDLRVHRVGHRDRIAVGWRLMFSSTAGLALAVTTV